MISGIAPSATWQVGSHARWRQVRSSLSSINSKLCIAPALAWGSPDTDPSALAILLWWTKKSSTLIFTKREAWCTEVQFSASHVNKSRWYSSQSTFRTPSAPARTANRSEDMPLVAHKMCEEGKLESRPTVTRLSLGCLILVRSLI